MRNVHDAKRLSPPPSRSSRLLTNNRRQQTALARSGRRGRREGRRKQPAFARLSLTLPFSHEQRHGCVRVDSLARVCDFQRPLGIVLVEPQLADNHVNRPVDGIENGTGTRSRAGSGGWLHIEDRLVETSQIRHGWHRRHWRTGLLLQAVHHDRVAGNGPLVGKRGMRGIDARLGALVPQLCSKRRLSQTLFLDRLVRAARVSSRSETVVVVKGAR